jgi:hypothetical protein
MKKSTFSPAQIAGILKEFDNGKTAEEIKPLFVMFACGISKHR